MDSDGSRWSLQSLEWGPPSPHRLPGTGDRPGTGGLTVLQPHPLPGPLLLMLDLGPPRCSPVNWRLHSQTCPSRGIVARLQRASTENIWTDTAQTGFCGEWHGDSGEEGSEHMFYLQPTLILFRMF